MISNQRPSQQNGRTEFYLACSCGSEHVLACDLRIDDRHEECDAVCDRFDLARNEHIEHILTLVEKILYA